MKWVVCDMMGCMTAFSVTELPAFTRADCRFVQSPVLFPKETYRSPVMKGICPVPHACARAGLLTPVADTYVFDRSVSFGGPGFVTVGTPAVSSFKTDGYTFVEVLIVLTSASIDDIEDTVGA